MSVPWGILSGIRPVKIMRQIMDSGIENPEQAFMSEFQVSPQKAKLALEIAKRESKVLSDVKDNEIGLYIGIPFCRTRCLYCSFVTNTAVNCDHLQAPYVEALKREIAYSKNVVEKLGCKVITAYIGGGTPTALTADLLGQVMASINEFYPNLREYTVEAGRADTIDKEKLLTIKEHGANRICINPQTMNDDILRNIGRQHTAEQVIESYYLAREVGFDHINMDLIAGLPEDTLDSFQSSVEKICSLDPEGITVHTMSLKRGSRLLENREQYHLTDGNIVTEMINFSQIILEKNNFHPYYLYRQKNILGDLENVGYAKDGYENLYNIMMMEEVATIVSLGAGGVTKTVNKAESRIERIFNYKEAQNYVEGIEEILRRKDEILKIY